MRLIGLKYRVRFRVSVRVGLQVERGDLSLPRVAFNSQETFGAQHDVWNLENLVSSDFCFSLMGKSKRKIKSSNTYIVSENVLALLM